MDALLSKPVEMFRGSGFSVKSDPMLVYFLSMLEVRTTWFEGVPTLEESQRKILGDVKDRISELLQSEEGTYTEDNAWSEAYFVERLVSLLEPVENLLPEIRRRLDEATTEQVITEPRLRAAFSVVEAHALDTSTTPPGVRAGQVCAVRGFLLDVLEEIHWTIQRKFRARPLQKTVIKRIVGVGICSFALLLLPYLVVYTEIYRAGDSRLPFAQWAWLPLYTALTAGLFGAFFSRLSYVQMNFENMTLGELKIAKEYSSIFLKGSVGMCGALVIFFFLQSNMVKGNLFPDFSHIGFSEEMVELRKYSDEEKTRTFMRLILPSADLALLVVWCFLAGFSERLVPSIISSTEEKIGAAAKGATK